MCGRFAFNGEQWPDTVQNNCKINPNYNISPQDDVFCLSLDNGEQSITKMKWGFRPSWSNKATMGPINARFETVSDKPMFRDAFGKNRCLIPATGWYEWKPTPLGKVPFYHRLKNQQTMLFAGIYDDSIRYGKTERTFCILTTSSHESIVHVHERMPLIISKDTIHDWLGSGTTGLMPTEFNAYPVSRKVNSTTAIGKELTMPIQTLTDWE